jgi:hypothetical protein
MKYRQPSHLVTDHCLDDGVAVGNEVLVPPSKAETLYRSRQ